MITRTIVFIISFLIFTAFVFKNDNGADILNPGIKKGEFLEYKVNFGIFTVGHAQMKIYPEFYDVNNRKCYKIDVFGQTSGAASWLTKVDDNWGAYIDSAALLPHVSWRKLREGRFRKDELVNFNHKNNTIEVKVVDKKTGEFKEPEYYEAPNNVQDIIGGFVYLRSLDYSEFIKNDTIRLHAFFEDTIYDFRIMYKGRETIKTKAGKFKAIKLVPIMPDNKLFAGENSVTMWLSDDKNKILIKAEANMFIGKAGFEITDFENVKHEPNIVDDG